MLLILHRLLCKGGIYVEKFDFNINDVEFFIIKDNLAWGDGEHETTKNMLNLIAKYGCKDKTVMDIGTGTGILSVCCSKLGAKSVLALDISENAVYCADINFKANSVEVDLRQNDLTFQVDNVVDVVLANLPDVMQPENLRTIKKNIHKDSILIISWWKKLDFDDFSKDFEVIEHIEGEDYDNYVLKLKEE